MQVFIAPDSFKETLSAPQVATIIAEEWHKKAGVRSVVCPLADGGEGTMRILSQALGGALVTVATVDPLLNPMSATYCLEHQTAIVELAEASGLHLVPHRHRNPLLTTTYGTGLIIKDALEKGASTILLTLGGSATNDGGVGIAKALGVQFLNKQGVSFLPTGGTLQDIEQVIVPPQLDFNLQIACDVTNPLLGANGASHTFAPQKGATEEQVNVLEHNMAYYARLLSTTQADQEGIGAAGGTAFSLMHFFNATLLSGIELIADTLKVEEKVLQADLVITGEGRFDAQSLNGKVVSKILSLCQAHHKPLYIICGSAEKMSLPKHVSVFAMDEYAPLETCLTYPEKVLRQLCQSVLSREFGSPEFFV